MGKRGQHHDSDAELWERVARSTRPLKMPRAVSPHDAPKPGTKPEPEGPAPAAKPRQRPAPRPAPAVRGKALDRGTARKLERGALAVEARLDLHFMRQQEAHIALRRFLKAAQAKGHRHVLVITGKGTEPDAVRSFYEEEMRGVLRQAVPHWLAAPELAHLVVSFSPAPRRLGGEGALYVRLRKAVNRH